MIPYTASERSNRTEWPAPAKRHRRLRLTGIGRQRRSHRQVEDARARRIALTIVSRRARKLTLRRWTNNHSSQRSAGGNHVIV